VSQLQTAPPQELIDANHLFTPNFQISLIMAPNLDIIMQETRNVIRDTTSTTPTASPSATVAIYQGGIFGPGYAGTLIGAIVGGVVGGLALIAIIVWIIIWRRRKAAARPPTKV
jgi:predicted lipid-binding transport protein (Tim44 family)